MTQFKISSVSLNIVQLTRNNMLDLIEELKGSSWSDEHNGILKGISVPHYKDKRYIKLNDYIIRQKDGIVILDQSAVQLIKE